MLLLLVGIVVLEVLPSLSILALGFFLHRFLRRFCIVFASLLRRFCVAFARCCSLLLRWSLIM